MQYMNEFLTIALVHLVAVASPGPDFAVVIRNSVAYGRRIAMYTSIGIGLAILLHVAYSLVGLSGVIAKRAVWMGFLTNGLNPKATLFFLSLFTAIISIDTPFTVKLGYGIYLAIATGLWFCFLSYLLSTSKVAELIGKKGYWLDRAMGVLLVGLAAKLVLG